MKTSWRQKNPVANEVRLDAMVNGLRRWREESNAIPKRIVPTEKAKILDQLERRFQENELILKWPNKG